jgi:hypothetical protein
VAGCCWHRTEPPSPIKCGEFFDLPRTCQLLKESAYLHGYISHKTVFVLLPVIVIVFISVQPISTSSNRNICVTCRKHLFH